MPASSDSTAETIQGLSLFLEQAELPLNSCTAVKRREQTALEALVDEIVFFDPDYAEQLALDGLNRMRH